MEGIGTLWLSKFGLSQNYRDVTATIDHSVSIFFLNARYMTILVNFIFNIIKIWVLTINYILTGGAFIMSFSIYIQSVHQMGHYQAWKRKCEVSHNVSTQ